MRVILECSLCERCNKFYKQKNVTGDYTPYCTDNRCTFRDTLIDNIRKSYSDNKQSDNLKITNTNNAAYYVFFVICLIIITLIVAFVIVRG